MGQQDDLLIEIGVEEMPARLITDAMNQFRDKIAAWLEEQQISHGDVKAFSTPRRLAVKVSEVAAKQNDRHEEAKGPAKQIALDDEGNWTKAAMGFAKSHHVDVDDLKIQEVKGKDYLFADHVIEGGQTFDLLKDLKNVIISLSFPTSMRWDASGLRFIRPIRWLLALYGDRVVPFTLAGVHTDHDTWGHRFLGSEVSLKHPSEYQDMLLTQYVIADPEERKQAIRGQLQAIDEEKGWHIHVDEDLLEEVNNLVEYPTALYGTFDAQFLALPKEVLMISMSENQRYFSVEDENGGLLPNFITVRNGNQQSLDTVTRGNEKVLHARLSDARFFWDEDQKITINDARQKLDHVVFIEELGTLGNKTERIQHLVKQLGMRFDIGNETLQKTIRAASICKFDIVTHMVDEFSELQGVIGEKYAHLAGESDDVSRAVREHYLPRFKSDELPQNIVSAMVAVADKIDTIVGCYVAGRIPTGSQDPYGLRRSATGIVQILFTGGWNVTLESLIDISLDIYDAAGLIKQERMSLKQALSEFFNLRMRTFLQERGIRYDVIDAVLSGEVASVDYRIDKADLINARHQEPDFKTFVETLSRVTNIAGKSPLQDKEADPDLFENETEQRLHDEASRVRSEVCAAAQQKQARAAYHALHSLQAPINDYFDHVMVMAQEQHLRENHLREMNNLSEVIRSFADFGAIVL